MKEAWAGRRLFWVVFLPVACLVAGWVWLRGYWAMRDDLSGVVVALHHDADAAWTFAVPYRLLEDLRFERRYNNIRVNSAVFNFDDGRQVRVWYDYDATDDRLSLVSDAQRPGAWVAFIDDFSATPLYRRLVAGPPVPPDPIGAWRPFLR